MIPFERPENDVHNKTINDKRLTNIQMHLWLSSKNYEMIPFIKIDPQKLNKFFGHSKL